MKNPAPPLSRFEGEGRSGEGGRSGGRLAGGFQLVQFLGQFGYCGEQIGD